MRQPWNPLLVLGYFALIAAWLWWELRGIRDHYDTWPSFTDIVKKYLPRWARALVIGAFSFWMVEHFLLE
jgi:hypothetical protein